MSVCVLGMYEWCVTVCVCVHEWYVSMCVYVRVVCDRVRVYE